MSDGTQTEKVVGEYTPILDTEIQPPPDIIGLSDFSNVAASPSKATLPTNESATLVQTRPVPNTAGNSNTGIDPFPNSVGADNVSEKTEENPAPSQPTQEQPEQEQQIKTSHSSQSLNVTLSAPKMDGWDEKANELRDVPPPITQKLVLPDFVPPQLEDEDFGKKTGGGGGFKIYGLILAILFILVAAYSVVIGIIILYYRFPIGLTGFICFFVGFLFACGGVVQLVGFISHPNKPVKHMFYTVIMNFIIFSVFLVAVVQIAVEKNLFEYGKETFKLRFARYEYRFAKADIDHVFDSAPLGFSLLIIAGIAAAACVLLAMVQCCYYVPLSWWNLICCIILPISCIVLGVTCGVVFLLLSFFATPFSHTNRDNFKFEDDSPAGWYFQKAGLVLLFMAAGLVIYIVVVIIAAKCYYNHHQAKKVDASVGWPDSDKVTYEFFRKKDFALPFSAVARNVLAIVLGLISVGVVIAVGLLLPRKEFTAKDGTDFINKGCLNFTTPTSSSSFSFSSSSSSSSLSLFSSSSSFSPLTNAGPAGAFAAIQEHALAQGHTHGHGQWHMLGFNEKDPCNDAKVSVEAYIHEYYGVLGFVDDNGIRKPDYIIAAEAVTAMTESTRMLVMIASVLSVAPLFPVVVMVVLLIVLLICGLCCFSLVSVFICGSKDTRAKIEKDMDEWNGQVSKGPITHHEDHTTLKKEKAVLEERITKFNKKLEDLQKEHDDMEKKINSWKGDTEDYAKVPEKQTGAQFDKLRAEKAILIKNVAKFNKKLDEYYSAQEQTATNAETVTATSTQTTNATKAQTTPSTKTQTATATNAQTATATSAQTANATNAQTATATNAQTATNAEPEPLE